MEDARALRVDEDAGRIERRDAARRLHASAGAAHELDDRIAGEPSIVT